MKTYAIGISKKAYQTLCNDAGFRIGAGLGTNNKQDFKVYQIVDDEPVTVIVRFKTRREAVNFAVWVSAWVTARWNDKTLERAQILF